MRIARIFEEPTGKYHVCDDDSPTLDARGHGYEFKIDAMRAAFRDGYSHCTGSGTYWKGITRLDRVPNINGNGAAQ
jgi:hypothetical protein